MSITVQELSKSFENKRGAKERTVVLSDISFEVRDGEFVSLLGPFGCGPGWRMPHSRISSACIRF